MLLIKWLVLPALVIGVVGVYKGTTGGGPQYRGVDSRLAAWAVLGAAAVTSTATAAAEPVATKQRIAITGKGDAHTFVLTPLTGGKLRRDSGTFSDCCWSERSIIRDGQTIEINNPRATYTGQRGTLIVRYRVEWANAGNGFTVGTGTWKIIRGTGVYKGITGGGRSVPGRGLKTASSACEPKDSCETDDADGQDASRLRDDGNRRDSRLLDQLWVR